MKNFILTTIFLTIFIFTFTAIGFSAGTIDRTFGTNGTVSTFIGANLEITDAETQPDNKILVLGNVNNATSGFDIVFVRYNANGTLDTSFGTNGIKISALSNGNDRANDLALQADGKIVVVGKTPAPDGNTESDFLVSRFNQNGSLDTTFNGTGIKTVNQSQNDVFNKVALKSNGQIVAVGSQNDEGYFGAVMVFNPNGSFDSGFGNGGFFYYQYSQGNPYFYYAFRDVKVLADNSIIVGGSQIRPLGNEDLVGFHLVKLTPAGSLDSGFGTQGFYRRENLGFFLGTSRMGFEILAGNKIFVTDETGNRILNSDLSSSKEFLFSGNRTSKTPDGKILVTGKDSRNFGKVKLFSDTAFIGKVSGSLPNDASGLFLGGISAAKPNGKIVYANVLDSNLSVTQINNISSQATRIADFDSDDKTNLIVNRPIGNTVYILNSNGSFIQKITNSTVAKKIVPEYSEAIVGLNTFLFKNNLLYYSKTAPFSFNEESVFTTFLQNTPLPSMLTGDIPVGGDYRGDGKTGIAYFRPSTGNWTISGRADFHWGTNGDKPVPADYDYDGITDYAIYRPSNGTWWVYRSSDGGVTVLNFGLPTDIPLTGDFDGDGKADFTVFRPSEGNWYQLLITEGFRVTKWGISTDIPVPGDYDGDGKHDLAVYRNGIWYLLQSNDGFAGLQWGTTGDEPVSVRYDN